MIGLPQVSSVGDDKIGHSEIWKESVTIEIGGMERITIETTRDAADCLLTLWPEKFSKPYRKALRACLLSLIGERPDKKVRKAFIKAAIDAHILNHVSDDTLSAGNQYAWADIYRSETGD